MRELIAVTTDRGLHVCEVGFLVAIPFGCKKKAMGRAMFFYMVTALCIDRV